MITDIRNHDDIPVFYDLENVFIYTHEAKAKHHTFEYVGSRDAQLDALRGKFVICNDLLYKYKNNIGKHDVMIISETHKPDQYDCSELERELKQSLVYAVVSADIGVDNPYADAPILEVNNMGWVTSLGTIGKPAPWLTQTLHRYNKLNIYVSNPTLQGLFSSQLCYDFDTAPIAVVKHVQ